MLNILKICRYKNLLFTALIPILIYFAVIVPLLQKYGLEPLLPTWIFWLTVFGTVLICAGGYVINDYFDVKIDRINRPDEVIAGVAISKKATMTLYLVLSGTGIFAGILSAFFLKNTTLGFIFVIVPGMLWFYSSSYKRQFLLGNIIVSICAALVPMLVLVAEAGLQTDAFGTLLAETPVLKTLYIWVCGFATFAFAFTLIREIIKDMEDIEGDREMECRTLPIVWGEKNAKIIVTVLLSIVFIALMTIVFVVPNLDSGLMPRLLRIAITIAVFIVFWCLWWAKTENVNRYKVAGNFIKIIMFLGLLYSLVVNYMLTIEFGVAFLGIFKLI
ncbi:MAG: geranylgeranylglycerol-phosphate geranylgeranyltransferase [Prevotellaceae bacterium]|jgi:4-hydroxybenzoate polyprenyltransferase|nr:geranylgeranylglycerol-phosphate geranylgeranyltransferase [Prevotellaceae bacterium]